MEREQLDRLLAEYATGGLTEEEQKALFTAAMSDQDLFDQLMEEDALREAIELPGARNRLIDSLQEELVTAQPLAAVVSAPAPRRPVQRQPMWLAWAAGIGVVFVSGAATYMLFDRPVMEKLAQVTSSAPKDTKPFVPPPSATVPQKPKPVVVEEPPKIMAENRAPLPPAVNIPLPSAPPPSPPPPPRMVTAEVIALKDTQSADKVVVSRNERDAMQTEFRAQTPAQQPAAAPPPAQQVASRPALARSSQTAPSGGAGTGRAAAREEKAKEAIVSLSAWRRTGDGVWIRVPEGESVGRTETIAVRYVPRSSGRVSLVDDRGQRIAQKDGVAGDELELIVPASALARAGADTLALNVVEGPATLGVLGGVARKNVVAPPVRIILRLR